MYVDRVFKAVRHEKILQLLQVRGLVGISEIAEQLKVSPATMRRDLAELEEQDLVHRTWGGVRLAGDVDDPFQDALARSGASKARIAAEAARMVPDGATVILDIGTTVHYLAMELKDRDVTVLTASLPAFEHLRSGAHANLIVLGGHWSEQYQCFEGMPVIDALQRQQADLAFLGCSGVSESGRIRDTSYSQSGVKRAIRAAATKAFLLADATKFPGKGGSSPFDVEALDGVVTDAETLAPQLLERCRINQTEVKFV